MAHHRSLVTLLLLAVTGCYVSCVTAADATANVPPPNPPHEELPKPEAYSDNQRRRTISRPSYDPRDAYQGLRSYRDPQDETQGFRSYRDPQEMPEELEMLGGSTSRLEDKLRKVLLERQEAPGLQRFRDTDEEYEGAAASYGGYGGYGSASSNYGLTCTSGYVNASAVALLAFLFLLNIVQDVITQITMGRRKRDAPAPSPLQQFLGDGGLDALYGDLPNVLLPLMVELSDAPHPRCIQKPLCEANLLLSQGYGPVGRVVGSLVTNIAAKTYSGANAANFDRALAAGNAGRAGSCHKVRICPRGNSKVSWNFGPESKSDNRTEDTAPNNIK